jgi:hypothetical protein
VLSPFLYCYIENKFVVYDFSTTIYTFYGTRASTGGHFLWNEKVGSTISTSSSTTRTSTCTLYEYEYY